MEWCREGTGWFLFIGRWTILGVRARARNHSEIPGRRLRCVGETDLACGPGVSAAERTGRGGMAMRGERLQQLTGGPVLSVRARARGMRERPEVGLARGTRGGLAGMALVRAGCGEVGRGERKEEKGRAG